MADASRVAVVVVTYDALPWIEQCLTSVRGVETVVVDNGSSDGTVAFVRERFPDVRVIEAENRGLGAGWNIGIRETFEPVRVAPQRGRVARRRRIVRLVEFAETRPRAAVVGPRIPRSRRNASALGARVPGSRRAWAAARFARA